MIDSDGYYEVIHEQCGKPAILARDKKYFALDLVRGEDFKYLDGTDCKYGDIPICPSCGDIYTLVVNGSDHLKAVSIIKSGLLL